MNENVSQKDYELIIGRNENETKFCTQSRCYGLHRRIWRLIDPESKTKDYEIRWLCDKHFNELIPKVKKEKFMFR